MKYETDCQHEYKSGLGLKKVLNDEECKRGRTVHPITSKPVLGQVSKCIYCGCLEVLNG